MSAVRLLTLLALACIVYGQSERGNISGIVTDPAGAAIGSAKLTIVHRDTNTASNVATTEGGEYNVPNLTPGTYRIEITAPGFKRVVQENVIVAAASTLRLDVQMQLGQVSETVEVTASAVQLQTDNAKVSTHVQNKLVDELPLVVGGTMRSPFNLVAVAAEAKGDGQRLALGGGQVAAWDATLDGHTVGTNRSGDTAEAALNTPSVEALTEFTVDTNGFKAEYGQAGGGVMTFASKSGTNRLQGTAYDFLRNDAMDARGFFASSRSVYRQNDFGVTASGPVVIPKLYDGRNKTFFFFAFEGFRNREGANDTILNVPTPEMYNGDFSNWVDQNNRLIPIYDPATTRANPSGSGFIRDAFPNNKIPADRFSALSKLILPYGQKVTPNRGGTPGSSAYVRNNYIVTNGTLVRPTDKWSVKGDQHIGTRNHVSFLWNMTTFRNEPGANGPPGLPIPLWNGQIQAWDTEAYRIAYDFTVSPTMVNHFSWFKQNFRKDSYSGGTGGNWHEQGICMKGVVDCKVNFPNIGFSDFTSWNATTYNGTEQPGTGFRDDLSYIRGAHTMKFGFTFHSQNANGFGQQNISGEAQFSFLGTSIPGNTSFPNSGGNSFASFLLGDAYLGRTETIRQVNQHYPYYGWYAQDDWRITRKLSINYGIRYEFTLAPTSATDEYSDFDPARPNPGADGYPGALIFAGFGPGRENKRALTPNWFGGISPRIGLAYAPDNKTSIRLGVGRSFSRVTAVQGSGHYAGFIGNYEFTNANNGVTPTFNWDSGLPAYKLPPAIDPAFSNGNNTEYWNGEATRAPENWAWTLSMQREIANTVFEVAYNASIGMHLQTGLLNINQIPTQYMNDFVARYGQQQALALFNADILSSQAVAAGIRVPYPSFLNQRLRTVGQALRPYPQYQTVNTAVHNGDKSGHSSYHALVIKADKRFSNSWTFNWNYAFSKLLTDSDSYFAAEGFAQDHYNRGLEKSIGRYDQTHQLKFSTIYELPFGRGKKWLNNGFASYVLGGWRLSGIQVYSSGTPVQLQRNNPLGTLFGSIRPTIDSYEGWRAPIAGDKFDPNVDRWFKPANQFPAQPVLQHGNSTKFNPKERAPWNVNENVSIAKSFQLGENRRIDLRGEAFNIFNRTVFAVPNTNLNAAQFGMVTGQANSPRQMQVGLKLYW